MSAPSEGAIRSMRTSGFVMVTKLGAAPGSNMEPPTGTWFIRASSIQVVHSAEYWHPDPSFHDAGAWIQTADGEWHAVEETVGEIASALHQRVDTVARALMELS